MKFCRNCGAEIDDNAIFCHNCGKRTNGDNPRGAFGFNPYDTGGFYNVDTRGSILVAVLSFCFWQAGAVLWLFWRRTRPGKATSALKGTLSSLAFQFPVAGLVLWLLLRHDYRYKSYAKIGAISAIVGAVFGVAASALLLALSYNGYLDIPSDALEYFGGVGAMFVSLFTGR